MEADEIKEQLVKGLDCAQVVLSAFAEEYGIDIQTAQKLTSAFGGGMFQGNTCGAVVGALIVLGLEYGFSSPVNNTDKSRIEEKALALQSRVKQKYGSCLCKGILGADISTSEGKKIIFSEDRISKICPTLIADIIEYTEDLIDEG